MIDRDAFTDEVNTWYGALLSGNYQQGTGFFGPSANSEYCCLGVANEVFSEGLPRMQATFDTEHECKSELVRVITRYDSWTGKTLASSLMGALVGFSPLLGTLPENVVNYQTLLWRLNDNGFNFRAIAQIIRHDLLKVYLPWAEENGLA